MHDNMATLGPAGFALVLTASAVNAQDTVRVRGTIDRVRVSWNFFGNVAVVPDDFPGDARWP